MKKVITRFAPSPTGFLHIGNIRTALINWLYARKHNGTFILRIDDTDIIRSTKEYEEAIIKDLKWLGLDWDKKFNQSSRLDNYIAAKEKLLHSGKVYPCYETPNELAIKRKEQLLRGLPPIYDRSSLSLTRKQINSYEKIGKKPYYRFMIQDSEIKWYDMIKGIITYQGNNLNDPIIIRSNGTMTYILCSTIDDIEYRISNIIRGEDHVTNTAIQIQIFEAFSAQVPVFGHLSLIKAKDEKISKRDGGFEIAELRKRGIEAMAINSFSALVGSSNKLVPKYNLNELLDKFNITAYSRNPTIYFPDELENLNRKLIIHLEYDDIKEKLNQLNIDYIDEKFWIAVRKNLRKISDIKYWWKVCMAPERVKIRDYNILLIAAETLPKIINEDTWSNWSKLISEKSGKSGKDLFIPLRLALTGVNNGPELKILLPLLSREEILKRLQNG